MKRITPEEVVAAYKETGLKPVTDDFGDERSKCGCALTALAYKNNPTVELHTILYDFADGEDFSVLPYDVQYIKDFISGFDRSSSLHKNTQGYQDGSAARHAVSKEFNLGWEV
jgi:hypothetical protein